MAAPIVRERLTPNRIERAVSAQKTATAKAKAEGRNATPADVMLYDADVVGLGVRIRASGAATYIVNYRHGGRGGVTRRYTVGPVERVKLPDARLRALAVLTAVHAGKDPFADDKAADTLRLAAIAEGEARATRVTLAKLVDAYEADLTKRGIVEARNIGSLLRRTIVDEFGADANPRHLTRAELVKVIDAVRDNGEAGKATKLANKAHGLLSWAADKGHVDANVLAGRRTVLSREERLGNSAAAEGRALSMDEVAILWRACDDPRVGPVVGAYVKALLITGCRRTELAVAKLSWIDRDTPLSMPVLVLPPTITKNGHAHAAPFPPLAMSVLTSFKRLHGTEYIFPAGRGRGPLSGWTHRWATLMKVAREQGLKGELTIHDLRRTARSHWTRIGVEEAVAELMLNHRPKNKLLAIYDLEQRMPARCAATAAWCEAIENVLGLDRSDDASPAVAA